MSNSRSGSLCCPAPECSHRLFPADINMLLTTEIGLDDQEKDQQHRALCKYKELLNADYDARLREALDATDGALPECLFVSSRLCPKCSVILTRNGGCPDFHCSCGANFHYFSAPRVIHQDWKGCINEYAEVVKYAASHQVSVPQAIEHYFETRKRTIGKLRVLLHQHWGDCGGWEGIERVARAAVMGEAYAVSAVKVARVNKRHKSGKTKGPSRTKPTSQGRPRTPTYIFSRSNGSPNYAVSCLLSNDYP
jgi:hypothetical protein